MAANTKTRIVVVTDPETGETKRFNISGAVDLDISQNNWNTGIDLCGVYLQPRAQRVIVHTWSRWEDRRNPGRPGRVYGDCWKIAYNGMIARLAREFDCDELYRLLPEFCDEA